MWHLPAGGADELEVPIRDIAVGDPEYPLGLRSIGHPPVTLYVAGSLTSQDRWAIAVVGSRRAALAAVEQAAALATSLAERGITVVSGLALGIDTAAHRGALSAPAGRTIAVVATGLDITFPGENSALDHVIRRRGAVVSQFPVGTSPSRTTFLARNEVIAAFSVASVVVAADERSGTRNEIGHAIAQGRPVVFWGPTMRDAGWARELVTQQAGFFADTVDEMLLRLGGPK